MGKKLKSRLFSSLMALAMVLSLAPAAFAMETDAGNKTITVDFATDGADGIQEALNYINAQDDKTGWTIEVGAGTYERFVVPSGLDSLTIRAADDADVTVETLTGNSIDYGFSGGQPDLSGIQIMDSNGVTIEGLTIEIQTGTALTHHMRAGISNHSESTEQADNFTIRNCDFVGTGNMSGQGNGNVGISVGRYDSFTIEGCTFTNLMEGIRGQSDNANVTAVTIDGNTFTNCAFAIHQYSGDSVDGDMGTYTFTNNTLTGNDLYCKAYFEDQFAGGAESNGYTVNISNNNLTNAIIGLVNLEDNGGKAEEILGANTMGSNSFVVSGQNTTGQIELHANYVAPNTEGYWLWTGKEDAEISWSPNPEGANAEIQAAIEKANEEGSHTLTFGVDDPENFLVTFTWFKDLIYWQSGKPVPKTNYPGIDKDIVIPGEGETSQYVDSDIVAAGDTVTFQLESNVPNDLLNYIEADPAQPPQVETPPAVNLLAEERGEYILTFHDQMDDAFDALTAEPVVKIGNTTLSKTNGNGTVTYYTYTANVEHPAEEGQEAFTCDFEIAIDLVALYEAGIISDTDIENATKITVTYSTTLNQGAKAGDYLNSVYVSYPTDKTSTATVTVETYGINIFKYDQTTATGTPGSEGFTATGLAGATFTLYDGKPDEGGTVVKDGIVSGSDGYVRIDGLDEGTYYLVETDAPDNYVKSDTPLEITITKDADAATNLVDVNFANSPVPHTGGMGTAMFTVGGAAILAAAGALFLVTRRRQQNF